MADQQTYYHSRVPIVDPQTGKISREFNEWRLKMEQLINEMQATIDLLEARLDTLEAE